MKNIENALKILFDKHRIVFWYDEHQEMTETFEALDLPRLEKIKLENNSFGIKYRILREEPDKQFLIYSPAAEPDPKENWLLDLQLANTVFKTDKVAMWLSEMGLPTSFRPMIESHELFFKSIARRADLQRLATAEDSPQTFSRKMTATVLKVDPKLEDIVLALLAELSDNASESFDSLKQYGLLEQLWQDLNANYKYESEVRHIEDFALKLFLNGFQSCMHEEGILNQEAVVLLKHWKDSTSWRSHFEVLSRKYQNVLNIKSQLLQYSLEEWLDCDIFVEIDEAILTLMMERLINNSLNLSELEDVIQRRKTSHWYQGKIEAAYQALEKALSLLTEIRAGKFGMHSLQEGFNNYLKTWYRIDQLYREYLFFLRKIGPNEFFKRLSDEVEKHYANNYLLPLSNNWQSMIDATEKWHGLPFKSQREFYDTFVSKVVERNAKVAVIISDALRYEIAEALSRVVEENGRFTCELDWMAGVLPSYTALGMASLLPHTELSIQKDGSVTVDGISSSGLENRNAILLKKHENRARALLSKDYKNLTPEEKRTLTKEIQVLYIYHNRIDAIGDKRETESETINAVHLTILDMVDLIKALYNANFNRIVITSDHGFLYQNLRLDEADLTSPEVSAKELYLSKRRFVIGEGLQGDQQKLKAFSAEQLGLVGDFEVLLAKSVNRMRLKGAGMQFVHGSSSLQEIVIPVLMVEVKKSGTHEPKPVEVDKIASSNTITTGQLGVSFTQQEAISTKVLERTLRVGIYAEDGTLISSTEELCFGSESENKREWEISVRLMLSNASNDYNNETVYLRLEEQQRNTDIYITYKQWPYTLNRTIGFGF